MIASDSEEAAIGRAGQVLVNGVGEVVDLWGMHPLSFFFQDDEVLFEQLLHGFSMVGHQVEEFWRGYDMAGAFVVFAVHPGDEAFVFQLAQFHAHGAVGVFGVVEDLLE